MWWRRLRDLPLQHQELCRRECLPARRASEGFDSAWSGSVYLAFGKACDIIAIPTREYINVAC